MKGPIQSLRVAIDKEWIRVGWAGMPTLRHHLIAFSPPRHLASASDDFGTLVVCFGRISACSWLSCLRALDDLDTFSSDEWCGSVLYFSFGTRYPAKQSHARSNAAGWKEVRRGGGSWPPLEADYNELALCQKRTSR